MKLNVSNEKLLYARRVEVHLFYDEKDNDKKNARSRSTNVRVTQPRRIRLKKVYERTSWYCSCCWIYLLTLYADDTAWVSYLSRDG